ncbi:hypothetical protein BSPWISOXPB_5428 [uncultured Gammaproteobacteria bacterium]|nr:hypothetical protein BSPWISOXPB_5428 [uncultured Gammaproteobacteria bacterium]
MSVVAKYLNKLPSGGGFVYRGQSDESWGLASTYYRRFNLNKSGDKQQQPTQQQFQDYHETLIKDAKSYHYHKEKLSDLELLLELQHYGAATGLVDFSRDFLIALWFAAHDNKGKNGKVFVLNINDIVKFSELQKGEKIFDECEKLQFVNNNFKSNNRIFAQKGVFIFGNQTIDNAKTIKILQEEKKPILQELSDRFSIDEKSLFQDIYGFSMVNDVNHPIYKKTAEEYFLEGNQDFYKSKFDKAIEAFKKAIEIKPNYEAYYNIGVAYTSSNKFKEAIEAYEKAIKIKPNYEAYCNIGIAYASSNKFKKAIEAYEKAIEIKPDKDEAYYGIGVAYTSSNKFKEAIEAFKKAIEIKPNYEAYYNIGVAYAKLDKFKEAIKAFKKAIEIKPNYEAYCNIGLIYASSNKFKEAIEAYEKAIKIKPDFDEAYCGMGFAYAMLNEFDKALEAYEKAIEIKPDKDEAYYGIGVAYASSNKFKEAIEAYEKAIKIKPDFDEAYCGMGFAYAMLNEFDKALEAYEKAIVLNSELIIKLSKQQNWYPLEQWINNLTDNDKKQQYLQTLKRLKDE